LRLLGVIASGAKQSSAREARKKKGAAIAAILVTSFFAPAGARLDCFVATLLAMT
jgi:hypothetical protein